MKKIVFYINVLSNGGAERVISILASQMAEIGYRCILVTTKRTDNEYAVSPKVERFILENQDESKNLRLHRNISRILKLRRICKENEIDVLVSFMTEANVRAIIASMGLSFKTVISVRSDPEVLFSTIMGKFIGKLLLPLADGCVFQTDRVMAWFPNRLRKKSCVILNPISQKFYETESRAQNKLVVTCGRLNRIKNHRMIISAISKVRHTIPNVMLKIYGEGECRDELAEYISALGLSSCVSIEGNVNDIENCLANADLFVLSSKHEGLPNALMEAMAVGVPCISTDVKSGGPRLLFGENMGDLLVDVDDEDSLVALITQLLENDKRRNDVAFAMRERAMLFHENTIIQQWINYLGSVKER